MYQELAGLRGGKDSTFWEVITVSQPYSSKYYPAIVKGEQKGVFDFPDIESYLLAKKERRRVTVQLTIAGNPIAAEEAITAKIGKRCLATGPNVLEIYIEEDSVDK